MLLMLSLRLPLQPANVKQRGPDAADALAEVAFTAPKL